MATVTYKCPNCDGGLLFDPESQKFHCEYCNSSFTREELEQAPGDQDAADSRPGTSRESDDFDSHAVEYVCPSCGAEVVVEDTTAATYCYYCHNPVVLSGRVSGKFRPQRVVPFRIPQKEVEEKFLHWCKKKRFMKRDFFSQSQREKLTGVYLPFWMLDCSTKAWMRARGNKVRSWRSGNTQYTETEEYELIREGDIDFANLPLAALNRKEMELTRGIAPYDMKQAQDFSMAYLSGFQAEKRNLEKEQVEPEAQKQLREYSEAVLRDTIVGYSGVTVQQMDHRNTWEKWRYTMLPVWVMTYRYREKDYYYAMNGQTGKVCGQVPLSWGRLAVLFGAVTAVAFAILMIGGWLL